MQSEVITHVSYETDESQQLKLLCVTLGVIHTHHVVHGAYKPGMLLETFKFSGLT